MRRAACGRVGRQSRMGVVKQVTSASGPLVGQDERVVRRVGLWGVGCARIVRSAARGDAGC
jgi:hypothetical protein